MAQAIESHASTAWTASDSINITKPTGLAEGDTLIAIIFGDEGGGNANPANVPAGWSSDYSAVGSVGDFPSYRVIRKVADAGDVSASNFTFTATDADNMCGVLHRISGTPVYTVSGSGAGTNLPDETEKSFTVDLYVPTADCIVFLLFSGDGNTGTTTLSGHSVTGQTAVSLTEALDNETVNDIFASVVHGKHDAGGNISAFATTPNNSSDNTINRLNGTIIIYTEAQDATGTNALLSVSPTHLVQNGVAGMTGTNALLEVSPTLLEQSGKVTTLTQWSNEARPTTDWSNETL